MSDARATADAETLQDQPTGWRVRLRAFRRLVVVVWQFLPLALSWWRDRRRFLLFGRSRSVDAETRRRRASFLLKTLLDLGPTFIKLGQMLSTRPDILPREYIDELATLQDQVPPADWERIEPVLERELGDVGAVFDSFDTDAISGASLGQVYTAEVDGEPVAVKVLRPGIRRRVEADLRVLAVLIPLLVRVSPEGQSFTLENLAEEFAATVRREMDYAHEGATLQEIAGNFADEPKIRMPEVYDDYSTDRVLTMEYVDGLKVTDVAALDEAGVDRQAVVERLNDAYIQMIVEDGVFHADPHPGNLAVQADGTIVFYDFGMSGRLDAETRDQLFEFYVGIAEDDIDRVIDAFVAMGALDPTADRELMRKVFTVAIDNFRGKDISQYRIEEIVEEFQGQMQEFPLRLPRNLALIVRVTSVLEGVCRTLDPDFDFIGVVREYVAEQTTSEETMGRVREEITSRAVAVEGSLRRSPPKIEDALTSVERDSLAVTMEIANDRGLLARLGKRIALGTATGGAVIATTTLYALGEPATAWLTGGAAVTLAILTRRSFRERSAGRDVQATTEVAERSLDQRRRQRADRGED